MGNYLDFNGQDIASNDKVMRDSYCSSTICQCKGRPITTAAEDCDWDLVHFKKEGDKHLYLDFNLIKEPSSIREFESNSFEMKPNVLFLINGWYEKRLFVVST